MTPGLRVVLADDHYLVREGVAALLSGVPGFEVVAAVADATALEEAVDRWRPDAVLTDIRMPPDHLTDGIGAAHRIRHRHPDTGVVVLSQHLAEEYVRELFAHGSAGLGYLLKERVGERDELVDALRRTAAGESVIDRRVVDLLVQGSGETLLSRLTAREHDVLVQMASGLTNPVIAQQLHLSLSSVEKHVSAIFTKLHLADEASIHRRVAAVLAFLEAEHPLR